MYVVRIRSRNIHQSSVHDIARRYAIEWSSFWEKIQRAQNAHVQRIVSESNPHIDTPDMSKYGTAVHWFYDFTVPVESLFDSQIFYRNYHIQSYAGKECVKDIRKIWELSRFQYTIPLWFYYEPTKDAALFTLWHNQISDWIEKNPLFYGPNWVCPMDVAIRAVNWLWALYHFKDTYNEQTKYFWQQLVASLYDHKQYLEHNWEIYGTQTNNHYISDLVGYLYLCDFFIMLPGVQKQFDWCAREIKKEFAKQVFDEGSSYEGSTSYHRLVTELLYHAFVLMETRGIDLSGIHKQKLKKMFTFIDACMINATEWIQIGDNDSGVLVFGITPHLREQYIKRAAVHPYFDWPRFGISIIKNDDVHISVRHHAYDIVQPTGHFHHDAGHVTLAYNSVSMLVDPGSYVYTASSYWRNTFRDSAMHNGPVLRSLHTPLDNQPLFSMPMVPRACQAQSLVSKDCIVVTSYLNNSHARATRSVTYAQESQKIAIVDTVSIDNDCEETVSWNFIFGPEITLMPDDRPSSFICLYRGTIIASVRTSMPLAIDRSYYSPRYGVGGRYKKMRYRALRCARFYLNWYYTISTAVNYRQLHLIIDLFSGYTRAVIEGLVFQGIYSPFPIQKNCFLSPILCLLFLYRCRW